ncbi:bifunctional endoribonuclease/protein kinase ire1 [Coemansia biformis]|uniref:non-specific serine/threonine protein kinase n=1 Tax=Coemansia biformis TaxID=1286918 RepID=A0A9W8CX07_9FUNG|nr:bifunctional endoribonuclease/protein kinase ire1 [Coemansia biformis]
MLPHRNTRALLVPVLCRDGGGAVPRKFTIPEPSVVADAGHKHIAMLPSKPYAAVAHEHQLLKRNMLARSGVSLASVMVVVTVDGRMYGVDRYDGSILWSRHCLFEPAGPDSATRNTCQRSMVRTKGRSAGVLGDELPRSGPRDHDLSDGDGDGDDGTGEEEWLLEQGIDWRSSPQVLERQRQLRREWLDRQRTREHGNKSGPVARASEAASPRDSSATADPDDHPDVIYIAEPGGGGGSLYMYSSEAGLKKLPLAIADLVDQSPVQVRGVLYTGSKDASFAAIDVSTGELLDVYGDAHFDASASTRHPHKQQQQQQRRPQKLLLGEKLNRVRIYPAGDRISGHRIAPEWVLHHRSVHAPSLDPDVDAVLAELSDAVEALGAAGSPEPDDGDGDAANRAGSYGPTKFVMTHDGGFVMVEAATGMPLWAQEFDSPVVSVFDVFGIATRDPSTGDVGAGHVEYVARRRSLSPAAQQNRYLQWRQLHETDNEALYRERAGFGQPQSARKDGGWRTGSSGGNILAGSFWERSGRASSVPQIAYIGKLRDTLYTLTSDEFPLIDHASLTSSLLLALVAAKRDQDRYPALQTAKWWDRWSFLTHDAIVLRVLQEARAWWLRPPAAEGGLALDNRFELLMERLKQHGAAARTPPGDAGSGLGQPMCAAGDRCYYNAIVGHHPIEKLPGAVPELGGEPLHRLALPGGDVVREGYDDDGQAEGGRGSLAPGGSTQRLPDGSGATAAPKDDAEDWPWWRYVGHYSTRVAAFIGFAVTTAVLVGFAAVLVLLRPRSKRRARMWVGAAGDDADATGRRARLRTSWVLMHRMWDTLKEEWRLAMEEVWRNPNAAAVLRRTGVSRRAPLPSDDGGSNSAQEHSRVSSAGTASSTGSRETSRSSIPRRGSASSTGLGLFGREDSEPSFERLPSGMSTPRRNSTGTLPMTPLKRASLEPGSLERAQPATPRNGQTQGVQLGAITLTEHVLGYGSHGTVVYRGEFQGRAVAVKRLLLDFYDVADHEVQVLQESDSHPNVIRYFCTERQGHFMYIALELCCGSLADAVVQAPKARLASQLLATISKRKILYQLACGLHHLHALKLVHRDIKPQNILVAPPPHRRRRRKNQDQDQDQHQREGAEFDELAFEDSNIVAGGVPRVLISDFGLSRILDDDESSFANTFTMHGAAAFGGGLGGLDGGAGALPLGMIGGVGGGTVGWRAPECFDSREARMALGQVAALQPGSQLRGNEPPPWPSLCAGGGLVEEPSPYVSRGTRPRLRTLAMSPASASAAMEDEAPRQQQQQQQQQSEGDDQDSTGTHLMSAADRVGSSAAHLVSGAASRRRMTRAVDVFSMGCVFYYVLMDGEHPFGDRLSREQRILAGTPELRALEASDNPSAIDAVDLIAHMVARAERDRPSAASVLVHPYFWDAVQRLSFLQDVSDCLEAEARLVKAAREDLPEPPKRAKAPKKSAGGDKAAAAQPAPSESIEDVIGRLPVAQAAAVRRALALLDAFEENSALVMDSAPPAEDGFQVVGMPAASHLAAVEAAEAAAGGAPGPARPRRVVWDRRLDPHLRRDLGKFRKYDGTRLRDLLRIIRNKKSHYQDMPPPLREALGDIPDGYLHYFESRFPYLLLHCYYFVLEDDSLRTATVFRPYFRARAL